MGYYSFSGMNSVDCCIHAKGLLFRASVDLFGRIVHSVKFFKLVLIIQNQWRKVKPSPGTFGDEPAEEVLFCAKTARNTVFEAMIQRAPREGMKRAQQARTSGFDVRYGNMPLCTQLNVVSQAGLRRAV